MGLPQSSDLFRVNVGGTQGVAGTGQNYSVLWSEMAAAMMLIVAGVHYTSEEVDSLLLPKADLASVYTIAQTNDALALKANIATTYTKTEVNDALANKANQSTTYTKTEVDTAISNLVNGAGAALNTLNELATALGNDPEFATTITTLIGTKADSATTLAGYGITDAYTSAETDTEISGAISTLTASLGTAAYEDVGYFATAAQGTLAAAALPAASFTKTNVDALGINASHLGSQLPAYYLAWANLTGVPMDVSDITALLAAKAPLASPALTGDPTAPTQAPGNDSTRIATTAFVNAALVAAGAITETDDLPEGATNLYYTTARANSAIDARVTKSFVEALDIAVPLADVTGLTAALADKVDSSSLGVAGGVATLDGSGFVPASQLPSYVDDVIEAANFAALPGTGSTGKIYTTLDNGKIFRWSGSAYVEISASPGSTDSVTEGATNLYYTTTRANSAIDARVVKAFVDALGINATHLGSQLPAYYLDYANFTSKPTLGTAAAVNTGTSGATLPFLNGNNAWSGTNAFAAAMSIANNTVLSLLESGGTARSFISMNTSQEMVLGNVNNVLKVSSFRTEFTNALIVGTASQTDGLIRTRRAGNNIEFGHPNSSGYASALGSEAGSGVPFLVFNAEHGTTNNTYLTRGIAGAGIKSNNAGGLVFFNVPGTNADNQSPVTLFSINSSGQMVISGSGQALTVSGATDPYIIVSDTTSPTSLFMQATGAQVNIGSTTNHPVGIYSNSTQRLTVTALGELTYTSAPPAPTGERYIGPRGFIRNRQDSSYTLVALDAFKSIVGYGSTPTWTVPSYLTVNYALGTVLRFSNMGSGSATVAITTDTAYGSGFGARSSFTLGVYGHLELMKVDTNNWIVTEARGVT